MTDNSEHKDLKKPEKIHLDEMREVLYWTQRFGCSERELRKVIKTAGNSLPIVEKFLKK